MPIHGPFQIKPHRSDLDRAQSHSHRQSSFYHGNVAVDDAPEAEPPERRYECKNYEQCLDLAAALNWESFTCKKCDGEINEALYWQARQAQRKDAVVKALCDLPPINTLEGARHECQAKADSDNDDGPEDAKGGVTNRK